VGGHDVILAVPSSSSSSSSLGCACAHAHVHVGEDSSMGLAEKSTSSRITDESIAEFQRGVRSGQWLARADVTRLVLAGTNGRLRTARLAIAVTIAAWMVGLSTQRRTLLDLSNNQKDDEPRKNSPTLHLGPDAVVFFWGLKCFVIAEDAVVNCCC